MGQVACEAEACADTFNVILVEDNPSFRMLITQQLQTLGCGVCSAADAGEFLGTLASSRTPFDLAVIDFQLPDMKGDLIISWLAESEVAAVREMPILVVTGFPHALPDDLQVTAQHVELLSKPYKFPDLESAVTRLLSGSAAH